MSRLALGGLLLAAATATLVAGPAAGGTASAGQTQVPKKAVVATVIKQKILVYHYPGATHAFAHYTRSNGYGQRRVFLVAQRMPGWERIYLPKRPNGSTGWVRDQAVSLAFDPFRVVVSLAKHRVFVYKKGQLLLKTKAGVGRSVAKTPKGEYFLVMLLKQPDPSGVYGPYAFGTSAFSNTYYHFGGGPGEIGLHGTDDPAALGTNVSHGCVRVGNAVIAKLAHLLPLGTPVQIK